MKKSEVEFLSRLAKGIAAQFGSNCEVVVHDLESKDPDSTIVAIENGQVSGRKLGDGPSNVVLKALSSDPDKLQDHFAYHTRTEDGRELRSSTVFFRDETGKPVALMTRDDKVRAIGFLNDSGAFLITKAGQKVCNYFGISKYTLYSYMDEAKAQKKE